MAKIRVAVKPAAIATKKVAVSAYNGSLSGKFDQAHKLAERRFAAIQNCDSVAIRIK